MKAPASPGIGSIAEKLETSGPEAQQMIPGRAKADKDAAAGFEQRIHGLQDVAGFRKMFERVERNDDLHGIGDGGDELASGGDSAFSAWSRPSCNHLSPIHPPKFLPPTLDISG